MATGDNFLSLWGLYSRGNLYGIYHLDIPNHQGDVSNLIPFFRTFFENRDMWFGNSTALSSANVPRIERTSNHTRFNFEMTDLVEALMWTYPSSDVADLLDDHIQEEDVQARMITNLVRKQDETSRYVYWKVSDYDLSPPIRGPLYGALWNVKEFGKNGPRERVWRLYSYDLDETELRKMVPAEFISKSTTGFPFNPLDIKWDRKETLYESPQLRLKIGGNEIRRLRKSVLREEGDQKILLLAPHQLILPRLDQPDTFKLFPKHARQHLDNHKRRYGFAEFFYKGKIPKR